MIKRMYNFVFCSFIVLLCAIFLRFWPRFLEIYGDASAQNRSPLCSDWHYKQFAVFFPPKSFGGFPDRYLNRRPIKIRTHSLWVYFSVSYNNKLAKMQRWASTLTSRSNARHRSNTRPLIERSERSYFFEKPKAKIVPSTAIFFLTITISRDRLLHFYTSAKMCD
jgi:hypothetical protein